MFIYLYGFKLLLCLVKKIQMSCQCFYVFILHGSIFIKEKKKVDVPKYTMPLRLL